MFEYLSPADRPFIDGLEEFEVVYAKDQPQYKPLRCLKSRDGNGDVMSRWSLTPEQRKAISEGADIFLILMTFNQPLQPILLAVSDGPNIDYFRENMNLPRNSAPNRNPPPDAPSSPLAEAEPNKPEGEALSYPATYEDCLEYHDNPSIDKKV